MTDLNNTTNLNDSHPDIPEQLLPLKEYGTLEFKDNILSFTPDYSLKMSGIAVQITIFAFLITNVTIFDKAAILGNYTFLFAILFSSILLLIIGKKYYPNWTIFDFNKGIIYSEIYFFGIKIKYNFIHKSKIIQISNNTIPSILNFTPKKYSHSTEDPDTNSISNQLHNSCVSLLLSNGKIKNIIQLGNKAIYYQGSKEIAKVLSEYLNIPLFICEPCSKLNTIYNQNDAYELTYDSIDYVTSFEKGFTLALWIFLTIFTGLCLDHFLPLGVPITIAIAYNKFLKF